MSNLEDLSKYTKDMLVPKGELKLTEFAPPEPNIKFYGSDRLEILRLEPNGDIFVKGKLVENDKEVVDGLREFLAQNMRYNI